jgi:hypothetical protein
MDGLILGVLDTSQRIVAPGIAARTRSWTLDAARFKHAGEIVEDADLGFLLARARGAGGRYCLVQAYGHVLAEQWHHEGAVEQDGLSVLRQWFPGRCAVAAARHRPDGSPEGSCWMVDLRRWEEAGRPDLATAALPDFPAAFYRGALHLRPEEPAAAAELAGWLAAGGENGGAGEGLDPSARSYLRGLRELVANLPRGVFVWNIEPYTDVDALPPGFRGPLSALYTVAAGLKPNRLLETHGFTAATRVVVFDYSAPGLRYRRLLAEEWDGRDYPSFLRRLFARLPPGEAYYCLWHGQTPETLDWDVVAKRWRQEVDAWGGENALARHWERYRRLSHRYVQVNLLADRGPLLAELEDDASSAIWWSNAFFSLVSNWLHSAAERRELYRCFLAELAQRAPRLWLYGASSDNVGVNHVQAEGYQRWFREHGGDELAPGRLQGREMRF